MIEALAIDIIVLFIRPRVGIGMVEQLMMLAPDGSSLDFDREF